MSMGLAHAFTGQLAVEVLVLPEMVPELTMERNGMLFSAKNIKFFALLAKYNECKFTASEE